MACPDRNKDERILREIERRKAMKDNYPFERVIHTGEFFEIEHLPEFDRVHIISKTSEGWELTLEKQK